MNVCDEKLREALMEAWKKEDARLREEIEQSEVHVFSEKFEQKMEELLTARGRGALGFRFRRGFM